MILLWNNLIINFRLQVCVECNIRRWRLSSNGVFTVKSFYQFLNDGELRCGWTPIILKGYCPKKVNLFNWLAWDDKILTLQNLALEEM